MNKVSTTWNNHACKNKNGNCKNVLLTYHAVILYCIFRNLIWKNKKNVRVEHFKWNILWHYHLLGEFIKLLSFLLKLCCFCFKILENTKEQGEIFENLLLSSRSTQTHARRRHLSFRLQCVLLHCRYISTCMNKQAAKKRSLIDSACAFVCALYRGAVSLGMTSQFEYYLRMLILGERGPGVGTKATLQITTESVSYLCSLIFRSQWSPTTRPSLPLESIDPKQGRFI